MSDESTSASATPPVPGPSPTESSEKAAAAATPPPTTWTLPVGIEDDIEQALFKTAVGAVAGGLFGLVFLRSGKGTRAASVATGVGVAFGSTYERVKLRWYNEQQQQENK